MVEHNFNWKNDGRTKVMIGCGTRPEIIRLAAVIKRCREELFFTYGEETGAPVYVYRFVNLMGHSRPKYNSAISTFCWAVANDEEFTVNDRSTELEVLYIDDLVEGMFDLLEGKEQHCEFDGVETVLSENGRYCCVSVTHKVTLGEIVDLLEEFKAHISIK